VLYLRFYSEVSDVNVDKYEDTCYSLSKFSDVRINRWRCTSLLSNIKLNFLILFDLGMWLLCINGNALISVI